MPNTEALQMTEDLIKLELIKGGGEGHKEGARDTSHIS